MQRIKNIVVAFEAEARGLVERLRLDEQPAGDGFRYFSGGEFNIVISGCGKAAAVAATEWLAARTQPDALWLNTGIAGHSELAVGEVFLAVKIVDQEEGSCWYPAQIVRSVLPRSMLTTVERPETSYRGNSGFDMESSAFISAARGASKAEFVQCIKVVSDNPSSPATMAKPEFAANLMSGATDRVLEFLSSLEKLAAEVPGIDHEVRDRLMASRHFTVSQAHQLSDILRDWQALYTEGPEKFLLRQKYRDAAGLLDVLRKELSLWVPTIPPGIDRG